MLHFHTDQLGRRAAGSGRLFLILNGTRLFGSRPCKIQLDAADGDTAIGRCNLQLLTNRAQAKLTMTWPASTTRYRYEAHLHKVNKDSKPLA